MSSSPNEAILWAVLVFFFFASTYNFPEKKHKSKPEIFLQTKKKIKPTQKLITSLETPAAGVGGFKKGRLSAVFPLFPIRRAR